MTHKNGEKYFGFVSQSSTLYKGTLHCIYDWDGQLIMPLKKTKIDLKNQIPGLVYRNNIFVGILNGLTINDSIQIDFDEHVTAIENDRDGNIWITTLGKGVYFLSKYFKELAEYNKAYTGKVVYAKLLGNDLYFVTNDGSVYSKKGDNIKMHS